MDYYLKVLKNYAVFKGRARRKEYWLFVLFNVLAVLLLSLVDNILGTYDEKSKAGLIGSIYSLAVIIPSIAVSIRRLHDTDKSGWWLLLHLIPLFGSLVLLIFFISDTQIGTNRFGVNPKLNDFSEPYTHQ
jgi:uncharacterized membrane protein YhaH (DUF805 family)